MYFFLARTVKTWHNMNGIGFFFLAMHTFSCCAHILPILSIFSLLKLRKEKEL